METFNLLKIEALNASSLNPSSVSLTAAGRDLVVKEEVFAGTVVKQVSVLRADLV